MYSLGRVVAWLLTGKWPVPNVTLLPVGRHARSRRRMHRAQPGAADSHRPRVARAARRTSDALRLLSPRATVADQVQQARQGAAVDVAQIFLLARQYPDDGQLYLDELALLPSDQLAAYTSSVPVEAAEAATIMLRHLVEDDWGRRQFDYANTPLGWAFTVLRTLLANGEEGLAEDLGTEFFRADKKWNRYSQLNMTVHWLSRSPNDTALRSHARYAELE